MHLKRSCGIIINTTMSIWTTGWMCQSVGRLQEANNNASHKNMCIYMHVYPGNVLLLPRKFRKMSSIICNVISIGNSTICTLWRSARNLKCHLIFGIMYMFCLLLVPTPTSNPLRVVIFSYFWMSLHAVLFCSSIVIQHKTLNLPGHLIFQLELVYDIRPPLGSRKTSVVVVSLRATSKKNNCLQNSHKLSISAKT